MKRSAKHVWIILGICVFFTLAVILLVATGYPRLGEAEFYTQDLRARLGRTTPPNDQLVLIGIDRLMYEPSNFDDAELQQVPALRHLFESYPWSREVWAELISRLADAGAKSIVLDIVFAAEKDGDDALQKVLDKYHDRVVIGYNISSSKADRGGFTSLQLPNPSVIATVPDRSPIEDTRLGFVTVWPDTDDVLRNASYRQNGDQVGSVVSSEIVLESLEARALRQMGRADLIPEGFVTKLFRYTAPPGMGFKPHPVGDVMSPKIWERNYFNGQFFKDKVVYIGPMAEIFHDSHRVPLRPPKPSSSSEIFLTEMPGPEIHLNIINAALHGEFLSQASGVMHWLLVALGGILAGALCFIVRQPVKRLIIVLIVSVVYWYFAQWLFDHPGYIIPVATPLLLLIVTTIAVFILDFVLEQLERMKLRHTMGLYFSPRVLEAVLADPGSMEPRRADVTLLLTDLRNSTPLAEKLGPQGMFELLNRVFEAQTNAIMSEEGNLEHFLGDQFLSYWGAPQAQPDSADRARHAAIKLITAMEKLRPTLSEDIQKIFGYGVALHSGGVLVGNKGSAQRLDYGLVGDTVNEAARIESLTKYYGVKLLASSNTMANFSGQSGNQRLVDRVIVKGKSEPVELHECENPCTSPATYPQICERYKIAYDLYSAGQFAEAQALFEKLIVEFSDGPSRVLVARCAELIAKPPTNWHGVWKMDAK